MSAVLSIGMRTGEEDRNLTGAGGVLDKAGETRVDITEEDWDRYQRHLGLIGGEKGQKRLRTMSALVTRCGGVGGTAALYLAAAGIGRLVLIHEGKTTWSNLNRMILQRNSWVGKPRILQIRESVHRLNRNVEVVGIDKEFSDQEGMVWSQSVDILLSCTPVWSERVTLNSVAVARRLPLVEAAMDGMQGTVTVVIPGQSPCLRCLYPEDPDSQWWDPWGFPVLGAVAGLTGCLAALEALKVLLRTKDGRSLPIGSPLVNRMLVFDLATYRIRLVKVRRRPDCPMCAHL